MLHRARFAIDYVESATEDAEATGIPARTRRAHELRDEARSWHLAAMRASLAADAGLLAEAVEELDQLAQRAADNAADARRDASSRR